MPAVKLEQLCFVVKLRRMFRDGKAMKLRFSVVLTNALVIITARNGAITLGSGVVEWRLLLITHVIARRAMGVDPSRIRCMSPGTALASQMVPPSAT